MLVLPYVAIMYSQARYEEDPHCYPLPHQVADQVVMIYKVLQ